MPEKAKTSIQTEKYFYAVGKRKNAAAQVRLFPNGEGKIEVNHKDLKDYFGEYELRRLLLSPIELVNLKDKLNITIMVKGGGKRGQADAIKHGISRALNKYNETFHKTLKVAGFLTRDSRKKERKKPGLKRARRAPQWAKR